MSLEAFKAKLEHYLNYSFNLNIYGNIGVGKTTLVKTVFDERKHLYLKFSDFINMKIVYHKMAEFMQNHILEIKLDLQVLKFSNLYELIQRESQENKDFKEKFKFYIIIDDINEIQCMTILKKQLNKILTLCNDFDINLVLISTFNLEKSEMSLFCDLSNFHYMDFPQMSVDEIKILIKDKFKAYSNEIETHFKVAIKSLSFYTWNLNELFYAFGEYLEYVKSNKNTMEDGRLINGNEMVNLDSNSTNLNLKNNIINSKKYFEKTDITKSDRSKLQSLCMNSVIHIRETNKPEENSNSIDLLTDNLSYTQKLVLLTAFLISETNPRFDSKIFKNVKNLKVKISRQSTSKSLKNKNFNTFTLHRLFAVYASLNDYIKSGKKIYYIDNEIVADVNNLIQNNLLKFVTNTKESNLFSRKIITTISIEFAEKLAQYFDIKLSEFINLEA